LLTDISLGTTQSMSSSADKQLLCARYIYKCDNFYILTVIVT